MMMLQLLGAFRFVYISQTYFSLRIPKISAAFCDYSLIVVGILWFMVYDTLPRCTTEQGSGSGSG